MAKPHPNHHLHHVVAVLLVFLILISSPLSSSARLLNDFNLALPSNKAVPAEKEETSGHVMRVTGKLPSRPGMRITGGKFGPMILNMLPKGKVPASGPSKGSNSINN